MQPLPVKICCIQDIAEARLAIAHGASALGLVSRMPSGWGPIPDARIADVARAVPPWVATVLLTAETEPDRVIAQQRRCRCNSLQLVDAFPDDAYAHLREALPGVDLIKVVHVTGPAAIDEAVRLAPLVDALLLDSSVVSAEGVRQLGGTGRVHDWSISAEIVRAARCPVILAGGLKTHNLVEAVRQVRPYGLDLCTGVRTDDVLDPARLAAFFAAVQEARAFTPAR
ncbi:MAG: phosphoribosylanthranilate isomerase [Alphaproteobacteria bacterium]|nr:phosphoribosylanthranilate isomerase [Alphaproteobacteria bacterium]